MAAGVRLCTEISGNFLFYDVIATGLYTLWRGGGGGGGYFSGKALRINFYNLKFRDSNLVQRRSFVRCNEYVLSTSLNFLCHYCIAGKFGGLACSLYHNR